MPNVRTCRSLFSGVGLVAVLVGLAACGGGGGGVVNLPPTGFDMSGTWVGEYTHPIEGVRTLQLTVTQSGTNFSGTWLSSSGGFGPVTGSVAGSAVTFTATYQIAICTGYFLGTGTLTAPGGVDRLDFTFQGSDCGSPVNNWPGFLER
jgi:hypothetical protein